jgi:hypothetical protein
VTRWGGIAGEPVQRVQEDAYDLGRYTFSGYTGIDVLPIRDKDVGDGANDLCAPSCRLLLVYLAANGFLWPDCFASVGKWPLRRLHEKKLV